MTYSFQAFRLPPGPLAFCPRSSGIGISWRHVPRLALQVLALSLLAFSVNAQEPPAGKAEEGTAYLRWWAVLGTNDPAIPGYSLTATPSRGKEPERLFQGRRGCYDGSIVGRFAAKPAGSYTISIARDDSPDSVLDKLQVSLQKGNAYTLSAIILDGKAVLRLDRDYPPDPGDPSFRDDIRIFNALADPPLTYQIGSGVLRSVPVSAEPLLIPRSQLGGDPLAMVWETRRKIQLREPVDYQSKPGPITVVFFRNRYNQANVLLLTSEADLMPATELKPSSPAATGTNAP